MNYGLEKPKSSFLKSLGLQRLYEKVSRIDKLEPKADKMHLHRTPKTVGYTSYFISGSKSDCFLNRVLSRGKVCLGRLSGRMVDT